MHELQVIPRVPPAAGRVDPHVEGVEVSFEDSIAVHLGCAVGHGMPVVQVRRGCAKSRRNVVRPVPLDLVEGKRVGQGAPVQVRSGVDREAQRGRLDRPGHRDPVGAGRDDPREVEGVHERVGVAPGAEVRPDRSRVHGRAARVLHGERRAGSVGARHQVGAFRRVARIPDLVHSNGCRNACGGSRRDGQAEGERRNGERRGRPPPASGPGSGGCCDRRHQFPHPLP